jgi:23S rRNA (cytosine1962-C5)-methyltransferase
VSPSHFPPPDFPDYALLDSGQGEKLERFGEVVVRRPDPQALWRRRLEEARWRSAHLTFEREAESGGRGGRWLERDSKRLVDLGESGQERSWNCVFGAARFVLRPTPFKHVGLFPEQAANWSYLTTVRSRLAPDAEEARPRLLNLFGYTGASSVIALQAGYEVTHLDASHLSLDWATENLVASGLSRSSMRLLREDALSFVRREQRRGSSYEVVLVDPPHYGRGPRGEKWQFEDHAALLLESIHALLAPRALVILSAYAFGTSPLGLEALLGDLSGGSVESGELVLRECDEAHARPARLLPAGFCARWSRGFDASEIAR